MEAAAKEKNISLEEANVCEWTSLLFKYLSIDINIFGIYRAMKEKLIANCVNAFKKLMFQKTLKFWANAEPCLYNIPNQSSQSRS